jgi:hypothetical protein
MGGLLNGDGAENKLSNWLGYSPFSGPLHGDLQDPQTGEVFKQARSYAEPTNFTFFPQPGPFTVGGISEVFLQEFLALPQKPVQANTQVVSVPERPVDQGTWLALVGKNQTYLTPERGVYLQSKQQQAGSLVFYGQAPNQGIYTGTSGMNGGPDSIGMTGDNCN